MTRDDILRMAREAGLCASNGACALVGGADLTSFLQRFASLAVADAMVRGLSAPIVVKTADLDPALLRDMLAKAPAMQLAPALEPTHEAIAAAVADEREACAIACDVHAAAVINDGKQSAFAIAHECASAIRARGSSIPL